MWNKSWTMWVYENKSTPLLLTHVTVLTSLIVIPNNSTLTKLQTLPPPPHYYYHHHYHHRGGRGRRWNVYVSERYMWYLISFILISPSCKEREARITTWKIPFGSDRSIFRSEVLRVTYWSTGVLITTVLKWHLWSYVLYINRHVAEKYSVFVMYSLWWGSKHLHLSNSKKMMLLYYFCFSIHYITKHSTWSDKTSNFYRYTCLKVTFKHYWSVTL